MVKCGPWTPKWIVIHKTYMYCVGLELKKKIKRINEPCCVGVGTYVPKIIRLNFIQFFPYFYYITLHCC